MKIIIATEDVLCFVWQDLGTTQIMTTVHSACDLESSVFLPKEKRRGIPTNSAIQDHNQENLALLILLPIREYNKHMGGSDVNSQARSYLHDLFATGGLYLS